MTFNQDALILSSNWLKSLKTKGMPDEYEAKQLLKKFNIPVPESIRLRPSDPIPSLSFNSPYAVKVCSPEILHKTDQGGVLLNIDQNGLDTAISLLKNNFPGTDILIEQQIVIEGPEFIVGAIDDPDYGIAVMAGAGGTLTEIYKDAAFRLAPCTVMEAKDLLDELKIAPVLHGYRGMELDQSLLAKLISSAGTAALSLGRHFNQLDINPVVFSKGIWVALDAAVVLNDVASVVNADPEKGE